ncbi:hypothetical protein ACFVGY_01460 [Streptomyces sp. NPDC127106]|uniref:hypothetical protein n=1 Tax=Streptomyces sp. NPDC127106 TaxID=3345360 RepID=UPI003639C33A
MLKPTRAVIALAAGSLVLGLGGAGAAVADGGHSDDGPSHDLRLVEPKNGSSGKYDGRHYTVGKVVSRGSLKVRSLPTADSRSVGEVRSDRKVAILCKVKGQKVDGNDIWYRLLVEEHEDSHQGQEDKDKEKDKKEDEKEKGGKDEEREDERDEQEQLDEQDQEDQEDQREEDLGADADEETDAEAEEGTEEDLEDELAEDSDEEAAMSAKRANAGKESKKAWVAARYVKNLDRVGSCD